MVSAQDLTGGQAMLARADSLAARLRPFHNAMRHLFEGAPEDLGNRLRILFYLLQETSVPSNELLGTGSASSSELLRLYDLGLIKPASNGYRITPAGESIITFLLFFDAPVEGALSEGFGQVLRGLLESQLDASTAAKILIGAARRQRESLDEATSVADLSVLDAARPQRKRAVDLVAQMAEKLVGRVHPGVEDELRFYANDLNASFYRQESTHTRAILTNVRYPTGHTHASITKSLGGHNTISLAAVMAKVGLVPPKPVTLPRSAPSFEEILPVMQRPLVTITETPTAVQGVVEGAVRLRETLKQLEGELAKIESGAALHDITSGPLTFNAGAWIALVPDHPWRKRLPYTFHVDSSRRVRNHGPYIDVPYITVQRKSHA